MDLVWCNFPSQQGYQFALKQTAALGSELNWTEAKPGRINVMMRAFSGDWEGDLEVCDKQCVLQLQLSLMDSFFKTTVSKPCVNSCSLPTTPIQNKLYLNMFYSCLVYCVRAFSGKHVFLILVIQTRVWRQHSPQTTTSCLLHSHFW